MEWEHIVVRAGAVMAFMRALGLSFHQACCRVERSDVFVWTMADRKAIREMMETLFQPLDS